MNYSETVHFYQNEFHICLVRKNMDVNGHERLSSFTNRHKFKQTNIAFIPVLHFTVTLGSLTMSKIHIQK
jgi:hypothetical protein